jgi:hypothetical protein
MGLHASEEEKMKYEESITFIETEDLDKLIPIKNTTQYINMKSETIDNVKILTMENCRLIVNSLISDGWTTIMNELVDCGEAEMVCDENGEIRYIPKRKNTTKNG